MLASISYAEALAALKTASKECDIDIPDLTKLHLSCSRDEILSLHTQAEFVCARAKRIADFLMTQIKSDQKPEKLLKPVVESGDSSSSESDDGSSSSWSDSDSSSSSSDSDDLTSSSSESESESKGSVALSFVARGSYIHIDVTSAAAAEPMRRLVITTPTYDIIKNPEETTTRLCEFKPLKKTDEKCSAKEESVAREKCEHNVCAADCS